MSKSIFLQIAYGANILILVPVVWSMMTGNGAVGVFEGKLAPSSGLELLVGSLWAAILLASVAGLFAPQFFAPVLLIQIIYKALWLGLFIYPLYKASGSDAIPSGITTVFVLIILSYPFLFWLGTRS